MAGIRFLIAGGALYAWTTFRGAPRPSLTNWKAATVIGGLLLLGGNGGVVWAEQKVPSGITAIFITTVPLWMALLGWRRNERARPTALIIGLILGFTGVVLLVGPGELAGSSTVDRVSATVLIFASLSWALGSLYSRRAKLPTSPLQGTAMEMLAGGVLLTGAGVVAGEGSAFNPASASTSSLVAFVYLIVFGSLIGFTSYVWLLKVVNPTRVSTYAYVNPAVAVFLGFAIDGEEITGLTLLAASIIIGAVFLVNSYGSKPGNTKANLSLEKREGL